VTTYTKYPARISYFCRGEGEEYKLVSRIEGSEQCEIAVAEDETLIFDHEDGLGYVIEGAPMPGEAKLFFSGGDGEIWYSSKVPKELPEGSILVVENLGA